MNFNKMFKLIVASTALIFTTIGFSHSASMPCGTAKLIVPWGAGGGTDVIFRQMVDKINKNAEKQLANIFTKEQMNIYKLFQEEQRDEIKEQLIGRKNS